ncbi:MAG: hypothetical protein ACRDXB_15450, partial [Actinomycetes bacterium]
DVTTMATNLANEAAARQVGAEERQALASVALNEATSRWRRAHRTLLAARAAIQTAEPGADRRRVGAARREARSAWVVAVRDRAQARRNVAVATTAWEGAAEARREALRAVEGAAAPRTSDADLVRSLTLGTLALVGLLGAIALLVPRAPQKLKYAIGDVAGSSGGGNGTQQATAGVPVAQQGAPPKDETSVGAKEPVWTQAVMTAVVLAAGVFGINNTEGLGEHVINVLLPIAPLIGAFFARRKVAPLVNLSAPERARLAV